MKNMGIIQGSAAQAVPLIVGKDTVYVHTNIKKVDDPERPGSDIYEYHEVQYSKDEYIQMIAEKNANLERQVVDTQLAIVDLYEGVI